MRASHLLPGLALLAAAACTASVATRSAGGPAGAIDGAESLVRAMHGRYGASWYRTLTFSQQTARVPPGGGQPIVETWLEYGAMPGRLRIEMGPAEQQRGAIYANDSLYVVQNGAVVARRADRNELMTLGFDVYTQPPEVTLRQLREEGFGLDAFHRDTWQDRPVYVVGAAAGDLRSKQFWVDAERLVFVRMLDPNPRDTTQVQDVRFNNYRPLAGGWIAPEVEIVLNGQRVFHEVYSDIRANVPLDPSLFDPARWTQAVHPPAR
ncbi:MAG TPA: hypothetical protein VF746_09450 [Longimicrobium sp.]|jgi:hypothetical protein